MLAPYVGEAGTGLPNWEPGRARRVRGRGGRPRLAGRAARDRRSRRPPGAGRVRAGGDPQRPVGGRPARARRGDGAPTRAAIASSTSRPSIPPTSSASAVGRRGLDAAVPRGSLAQPDRCVGGEHRPRAGEPRLGVALDPRGGRRLAFGSDWPVVPFDPFRALNSAVNRQTIDGEPEGGWLPGERLAAGGRARGLHGGLGVGRVRRPAARTPRAGHGRRPRRPRSRPHRRPARLPSWAPASR